MTDRPHPDDAADRVFNAETRRALRRAGGETLRMGTLIVVVVLLCIIGYALPTVSGGPLLTVVIGSAYVWGGARAICKLEQRLDNPLNRPW
jgi:hypothetical protein